MKKPYTLPTATLVAALADQPLLICVSSGNGMPSLTVDDSEGDASEALVHPFALDGWDW